jgi:peptidoglycan/LPS O-acetylase OafA/YrhL
VSLPYVPALDGIRGAAVAAVLLFHAGHLTGGFLGVDLFFVLSGFLITSLLVVEVRRTDHISLPAFWARRARRLLPALAGVLLGVAAYAWLLAPPAGLARIRGDALATAAYVANWRAVVSGQDYWDMFVSPSPLEHTWSLAIEEQFYVAWPLLLAGLVWWRARRRAAGRAPMAAWVLVLSTVLALASALAMALLHDPGDPSRVYFGADTRAASILVGAALAAVLQLRGPVRSPAVRWALEGAGILGVGVLAFAWTQVSGRSDALYRGGMFVTAVATAAVIAAVVHPRQGVLGRALSFLPLRALGLISYGVYLWHWPVYVVLDADRTDLSGWPLVALRIAATLVVATVSYIVVEQPIRRGALRPSQLKVLTPAVASLVVIAVVLGTGGARPEPLPAQAAPDAVEPTLRTVAKAPPGTQRVMVVGNSVGYFLAEGMKALGPEAGVIVLNRAVPGCVFPPGVTGVRFPLGTLPVVDCAETWAWDVARFRPDLVLFSLGNPGDGEVERDGRWLHPCTPEYDSWYERELREAVGLLSSWGAEVAIATAAYVSGLDLPEFTFDRDDCVSRIDRIVAEEEPGATLVDVARYVCPTRTTCRDEIDGVPLRPDFVHYRDESAALMADWVLGRMRAAA